MATRGTGSDNIQTRVPVVPLRMSQSKLAVNHEILVDDETNNIFIHIDGQFFNVTASILKITNEVYNRVIDNLKTDQDTLLGIFRTELAGLAIEQVTIRLNDGTRATLREILSSNVASIKNILKTMVTNTTKINGHPLTGDVNISASDINTGVLSVTNGGTGANNPKDAMTNLKGVPSDRKINNIPLENDITLKPSDIGAIASSEKGKPNGVAGLDSNGQLPEDCVPTKGGLVAQDTPPENTKLGWIDTSAGNILKFYDGSNWVTVNATWG